jgi:VIT1/CCC1 family predicted Fe2+/Mn2+ transporter
MMIPQIGQARLAQRQAAARLNVMRAAVLGASDGIVETAGLVVGVASATSNTSVIFIAGLAGVIAGALSMGAGEYVSVHSQLDSQKAALADEERQLAADPDGEFKELTEIYESKGLTHGTALQVATELTENNAFHAHIDAELGIDPGGLMNPWHAAFSSIIAFFAGAAVPLLTILLVPLAYRIPATVVAVVITLAICGSWAAKAGGAKRGPAMLRVIIGGLIAMAITYMIGSLFHVHNI